MRISRNLSTLDTTRILERRRHKGPQSACGDNLDVMRTPAVAVKLGQRREAQKGFQIMGTITCDGCGERFWIRHSPFADPAVAARQAVWLEKVLANDHERERKHQDKIELP